MSSTSSDSSSCAYDQLVTDVTGRVQIYVDGCCLSNGYSNASAGIGVWFNDHHPWNVSEGVHGRQTNNTAEYQAMIRALEIAGEEGLWKIRILTDSVLVYNSVRCWIDQWRSKGWVNSKGRILTNIDEIQELASVEERYLRHGGDVLYQLVPAHGTCRGNNEADRLAKAGAED